MHEQRRFFKVRGPFIRGHTHEDIDRVFTMLFRISKRRNQHLKPVQEDELSIDDEEELPELIQTHDAELELQEKVQHC